MWKLLVLLQGVVPVFDQVPIEWVLWGLVHNLPHGCHGDEGPPHAFPEPDQEVHWEIVRVPVVILTEQRNAYRVSE